MVRPNRVPVAHAFRVVPHAIGIDDVTACGYRDINASPIDMGRNTQHHFFRRIAEPVAWPCSSNFVGISAYSPDVTITQSAK